MSTKHHVRPSSCGSTSKAKHLNYKDVAKTCSLVVVKSRVGLQSRPVLFAIDRPWSGWIGIQEWVRCTRWVHSSLMLFLRWRAGTDARVLWSIHCCIYFPVEMALFLWISFYGWLITGWLFLCLSIKRFFLCCWALWMNNCSGHCCVRYN